MSTVGAENRSGGESESGTRSGRDGTLLAVLSAWFFLTVLLSSVWPDPAIVVNEAFFDAEIVVDEHAFFGREPFQWDAVMWFLLGLPFIAALNGRTERAAQTMRGFRSGLSTWWSRVVSRIRALGAVRLCAVAASGAVVLAAAWVWGDAMIVEWLASVPETMSNPVTRPLNRLGDGLLLTVCVLFIAVAGASFGRLSWVLEAFAMLVTSATAGIVMSAIKKIVGRVRPELWTSPVDFASGSESFPSGHSLYAAAFVATILFAREQRPPVRWALAGFVSLIPLARIVNFRHWPSDVLGSILLVTFIAWIVVPATMRDGVGSQEGVAQSQE